MPSFNRTILCGNLVRDPELRQTQNGISVCSFSLAVNRPRSKNEDVDFLNCVAWRELADTIAQWKKKGDPILVEGRLQSRNYEAKDGSKRTAVEVVVDSCQFLGRGEGKGSKQDAVDDGLDLPF